MIADVNGRRCHPRVVRPAHWAAHCTAASKRRRPAKVRSNSASRVARFAGHLVKPAHQGRGPRIG